MINYSRLLIYLYNFLFIIIIYNFILQPIILVTKTVHCPPKLRSVITVKNCSRMQEKIDYNFIAVYNFKLHKIGITKKNK